MSWIIAIFLLIATTSLSKLTHSKSFIGAVGEQNVRSRLNRLDKSKFLVINDLMIPNSKGDGTSQIDHVVIGPCGIVVIETKNFSGRIFGKGNDRQWTVVLGRRKYRKENPILQNKGYIAALRVILGYEISMYNFVVFGRRADLRLSGVNDASVIHLHRLVEHIWSIQNRELTGVQIHAIYQQLMMANITDTFARKQHVENIKQRFK